MSVNISNAVNVSLNQSGALAQADNQNVVCVVTTNSTIGLSENNRTESFTDLGSVGLTFGTTSNEYGFAQTFFSTKPNSTNAGGRLVFGYRGVGGGDPEVSGSLNSGFISDVSSLVSTLQTISDGYFTITESGFSYDITGLDFTGIVDFIDASLIISNAVSNQFGGSAFFADFGGNEGQLIITTASSGSSATIEPVVDNGLTGTFVGNTLLLTSGTGAIAINGSDATGGATETVAQALDAINEEVPCKGFVFIDEASDSLEIAERAAYAQASQVLIYEVFSSEFNLETEVGNPVWDAKLSGQKYFRMLYSKANNRRMAVSYMARMHSVNFNRENSAITMQFKELAVQPESYTQSEVDAAKNVGLDIYTTFKNNVPALLTSGANDYTDNVYNLMAFVEDIKVNTFNILKGTSTKIAQTVQGVNQLIDVLEKTSIKFVNAGFIAPGTWTSTDTFGDLDTFNKNIELNGFYWLAGSLAAQSQAERQSRVSPVLQGAIKSAGAIHQADIVINFNE